MSFLLTPWHIACDTLVGSVPEHHLNHICSEAMRWYNTERGHSARENVPPAWESPPEEMATIRRSEVVCTTRLGGLLKHYQRRAA